MSFDFDLFVIGGGSGGVRAARVASQAGAKVALAEEYRYGGTCVIRGCVPKKLFVYASSFPEAFEDAAGYGWTVGPWSFDWATFMSGMNAEISRLEAIYHDNLRKAGVQLFGSRATIADPHRIRLATGAEYSAKHILVATGGAPFVPDMPGAELGITSNEMFRLEKQPERIMIVGGGYIACEFAGIMNGLGTHVTQMYRGDQILRGFDEDVRDHVAEPMRRRGIVLEIQRDITAIEKDLAGALGPQGVGQSDADGFRIALVAAGLIADQALAIKAGHHAGEHQLVAFEAGVHTDGHLAAALELP